MKKFLTRAMCIALLLLVSITAFACGEEVLTNDYITPSTGASFSGSTVKFTNSEDFGLEYKGDNHYVAKGTANSMTAEQATAWGTVEGSKYFVVNIKMGAESNAIIGWRNEETKGDAFEESEIDGSLIKRSTAKNATKNYILAITDGETERHPELTTWRIEVTPKDATESVAYTIDFSALYENLA